MTAERKIRLEPGKSLFRDNPGFRSEGEMMGFKFAEVDRRALLKVTAGAVGGLGIGTAIGYFSRGPGRPSVPARPWVLVTPEGPDDGGDFGPNTRGTKTAGIQEALDYAHDNERDVYVAGGRGGMHGGVGLSRNVYNISETLKVPWMQDFILDGGNYVLNYTEGTGDIVTVDSQMNCRYKFGLIVGKTSGAGIRIKPETPGPDDAVVVTASVFDFSAVVNHGKNGTGIMVDSSEGPVSMSKIFSEETNTVGKGVHVTDNQGLGSGVISSLIQVMYTNQYHATGACTGLQVGEPRVAPNKISNNVFETSLHAPRGVHFDPEAKRYVTPEGFEVPEDAVGVDIYAENNLFTLSFYGTRAPGKDIIFQHEAKENTVFALNLPNGITNRAASPTNRIIPNWSVGFDVITQPLPASGEYAVNTNPYNVEVFILRPGKVSAWTITDPKGNSQTFTTSLSAGQMIILGPGDRIRFDYAEAPTWRWKGMR